MTTPNRYAVALAVLNSVKLPLDEQVEEQDVHIHRGYLTAEELDLALLLSLSEAGKLRVR